MGTEPCCGGPPRLSGGPGRTVTSAWLDLAVAGMTSLRPGTVLDGEAVIYNQGLVDFAAVQSRAASGPVRARELAAVLPASYAVWDVLAHPELGDVRGRPYTERRALLLDLLHDVPPPIQAVPATDDPEVAPDWYDTLQGQGIEGVVCKRALPPYRAGRIWKKVRHSDTVTRRSSATWARRPGFIAWWCGCRMGAVSCRRR